MDYRKASAEIPGKGMVVGMENLRRNAYEIIRDKIDSGEYMSGKIYTTVDISKDLGMSRTPVREALIRLATEDYVKEIEKAGFQVVELSVKNAMDISGLFLCLEQAAVATMERRNAAPNIAEMKKSLERQRELVIEGDFLEYYHENSHFHQLIIAGMNNAEVMKIYARYMGTVARIGHLSTADPASQLHTIDEHEAILNALSSGDYEAARQHISAHYRNAIVRVTI